MCIKERLQIILITYNRSSFVKNVFRQFFFEGSPVIDCDFLVLDNNSTDDTQTVVEEFAKAHPNVRYSKNKYNIGISGNITKAMEIADKDYVWIIGDDDIYDFSNWTEVEQAINNNEEIICVARCAIPQGYKNSVPHIVGQLTFITGGIYKTSLYTDTTIKNAFDNIYTLFPHIAPVLQFLNDGKKIYVVEKAIADNGYNYHSANIDNSYTRGFKNLDNVYIRTKTMNWIVGYSNICSIVKDSKLREAIFMHGLRVFFGANIYASETINAMYNKDEVLMQYIDIYMAAEPNLKRMLKKFLLKHYFNQGIISLYKIRENRYIKLFNGLFCFTYILPSGIDKTYSAIKRALFCYIKLK